MNDPNIVAMLRIKNESRWIEKVLQVASTICSEIVVLDDGSTDNTVEICKKFDEVVDIHQQSDLPTDQTRDKNILLKMARARNPDFILSLDGDEIIQPNAKRILFEELNILYPDVQVFEFEHLFMWDKPNQYRYDGIYTSMWRRKLLRMSNQPKDLHFDETGFAGNGHCPNIPQKSVGWNESVRSKIKILHYGYYDEEVRQKKYRYYTTRDSDKIFDGYRYLISGEGKFSGPHGIKLRTMPEGAFMDFSN